MVMEHMPDVPEETTEKPRRKPRIPSTPRVKQHRDQMAQSMRDIGRVLPQCPTNPDELAAQWQLGADDLYRLSVKILRAVKGTQNEELVDEVTGTEYHLGPIAGRFGPGLYFIRGGGRWASKVAKVPIAEELARKNGWGRAPELPSAADLAAQRTLSEAASRPTDPLDLAAAMETAARRAAREAIQEILPQLNQQGQVQKTATNPGESLTQFREMMAMVNGIREDVRRDVERSMGITKPEPAEEKPWWADLVQSLGPVLQAVMTRQPAQPVAIQAIPAAPPVQAVGMAQPPAPVNGAPMAPQNLPALTPEEQAAARPAVGALRQWSAQLLQLGAQPITEAEASAELVGLVPPVFYESLIQFDAVVQAKGAGVLGYIDPGMATERWRGILHHLAEQLKTDEP